MKIAIVTTMLGNFTGKGFYQSQDIGLGKTLAEMNHFVHVYKCMPQETFRTVEVEHLSDHLSVTYTPAKHIGTHSVLDTMLIEEGTELLFTFSDTQITLRKLYKYCLDKDIVFIPYVGIAHSWRGGLRAAVFDSLYRCLTLPVYKKCTVMAKTKAAKRELESQGAENVIVAPVGMDFASLKQNYEVSDRSCLRKKWGFSNDDIIISFVARLQAEKRPLDLIEIFARLNNPKMKLLIIGKGDQLEMVKERVDKYALAERVKIIEQVPYADMWEIHYIADCFINLRAEEIFGMAIMEAVYYKSAVLAIRAPGSETILDGMAGHYICDSDEEIADHLNAYSRDEKELEDSKRKLEENFTWRTCADTMLDLAKSSKTVWGGGKT